MLPKPAINFAKREERAALLSGMLESPTTQGSESRQDYCFPSVAAYRDEPVRQANKRVSLLDLGGWRVHTLPWIRDTHRDCLTTRAGHTWDLEHSHTALGPCSAQVNLCSAFTSRARVNALNQAQKCRCPLCQALVVPSSENSSSLSFSQAPTYGSKPWPFFIPVGLCTFSFLVMQQE